jgi:hypothetical protein
MVRGSGSIGPCPHPAGRHGRFPLPSPLTYLMPHPRIGDAETISRRSARAGQHLRHPLVEALSLCLGGQRGARMDLGGHAEQDLPRIGLLR